MSAIIEVENLTKGYGSKRGIVISPQTPQREAELREMMKK